MDSTLAKKQDNIQRFILNNGLIPSTTGDNESMAPPDITMVSFPISSLMKKAETILPHIFNYSTTLDGFPDWYAWHR